MNRKDLRLPFDKQAAEEIAKEFGTPLHIYDERGIRETAQRLNKAFEWAEGYKNFFAVKATPTPVILKILQEECMGFDCSSRAELAIMQRLGVAGEDIFYSSNNTPKRDFELAIELGATVNIDDLSQASAFKDALNGGSLNRVAARYNPGSLKSGNDIIGEPTEAKYGMGINELVESFKQLKRENIKEFGLHTMVASNELSVSYFTDTAELLLEAVEQIEKAAGITISFINLGGGFGLNYRVDQEPFDVVAAAKEVEQVIEKHGKKLQVYTEHGRYVTGSQGFLLTRVQYVMEKYKTYLGVDASMQNLMRPGMYGAYHHITVLGKEDADLTHSYDVVGALCENNDKFAIDRELPEVESGDLLVIHDAGAHGHAMGFNYNGLLRSAEMLIRGDGKPELIRRGETVDQYLQNIVWPS
ncbi:MAG: diaminopimelate decarboxylase [Candidatus Saccharibacteria bacterium]|nr:diaminopimelate decarboxylase [Candidatus Saccharibacteria bacterium]